MLRELHIRNVAVIDELSLSFAPGLNAITGETGAGKSILMHSLALVTGARGSGDIVRGGSEEASVTGVFDVPDVSDRPEALGLDDDDVVIRRIVPATGKGKIYVNGTPATLTQLASLAQSLVHLHGQRDQALLLRPANHRELLDDFGGLVQERIRMAATHAALMQVRRQVVEERARGEAGTQHRELLAFQISELRAAAVQPDEEADLRREREVLRNALQLRNLCGEAEHVLYSGDRAVLDLLGQLVVRLRAAAAIDRRLEDATKLLEAASAQLDEVASQLRLHGERVDVNPDRQETVEDRLALLARLGRKYQIPSAELPATLAALETERQQMDARVDGLREAEAELERMTREALKQGRVLASRRERAARKLEKEMSHELTALGMRGGVFSVVHKVPESEREDVSLTANGIDQVEFYLSTNSGEPPRPLAKIASGGELSRLMLALRALTATAAAAPTLVFDEVDAGIGGAVADAVAQRLRLLAGRHQLVCLTHLPQIAAYADHHIAVEKVTVDGRTRARARVLRPEERIAELSRMLGGEIAPAEAARYASRLMGRATAVLPHPRLR